MSDQDMELALRVTGDASGAVSAVSQTTAAMDRLPETINISQASLDRLSASLDSIVKQHGAFADSSDKVKTSLQGASKEASEFNSVGGDMARMFSSIGVQSGEAASRIGALGGALGSLREAAPEITLVVAAMTALFGSFEFIKDAISSASELQNSMSRLGAVVTAQGGNWNLLSAQVKEFTAAQVAATTFTDTAVINSVEKLVASGMSLKDSMTSTRIAEDLAAASGRTLEEATNSLVEATHGRLMGLEAEGVLTKEQVKNGLTYDQVLQQIESHMGGAALSATQTYTGALSQLGAEWQKLLEDAGTPFLGLLVDVVKGVTTVVDSLDSELQPAFKAIGDWASSQALPIQGFFTGLSGVVKLVVGDVSNSLIPAVEKVEGSFEKLGSELDPLLKSQFTAVDETLLDGKQGWDAFDLFLDRTIESISNLVHILGEVPQAISDMFSSANQLGDWVNQQVAKLGPLGKAIAYAEDPSMAPGYDLGLGSGIDPGVRRIGQGGPSAPPAAPPSTHTDFNPMLGGPAEKKPKAATPTYDAGPDVVANYHDQSDALQKINEWLSQLPKTVEGYNDALQKLAPLIADDTSKQTELGAELDNARNRLTVAADDYNTYKDSLQGVTKVTAAQQEQLRQYKDAYESAQKSVDNLSSAYDKNRTELQGLTKDQQAARDALNKLKQDYADFITDTADKDQEELATFKMTNAEKVPYYRTIVNQLISSNQQFSAAFKQAYASMEQAAVHAFEDEYHAQVQFEDSAAQKMSSFLDTIVVQHQSMASALKNIYDDILKYFVDMVAKMLAEALMTLPWIQALLGFGTGGFAPGSTEQQIGGGGPGSLGGASAAPSSTRSALASIASSPAIAAGMSAALSPSGGGGSVGSGSYGFGGGAGGAASSDFGFNGGGSSPNFTNLPQPSTGAANPTSSGGASGGTLTGNGFAFGPSGSAGPGIIAGMLGRGGLLGSLGMAGVAGMAVGDLAFGGKGYSALGGMLGALGMEGAVGLTGAAFAGGFAPAILASLATPLGWGLLIGAALLGAFGGSLFGDHFSAADEPDISQTDAWGQANADMQGMTAANPMNANGKQFVMDSQTSSATGGRGWNIMMEKFVQQYRGNLSTLPYTLQAAFPNIEQLWGGATDKQFFNPDGKDGYLDIGSGKRAPWSDFWGVITQYGQSVSQLMQGQTATEMYVTNVDGLMRSIGSGTPTPGGSDSPFAMGSPGGGGSGSNAVAAGGPGRIGASLAQRLSQSIAINVNVNNSSTLTDTANLSRALRDAFGTTLPSALEDLNVR